MSDVGARRPWLGLVAAVLWVAYALPLFFPPPQVACGAPIPPDAMMLERLFPDVPAWWIALRLACLFAAATIVAALGYRGGVPVRLPVAVSAAPPVRTVVWIAMAIAAAQLIAAVWADQLQRPAQLFYIATLAAPSLLLLTAYRSARGRGDRRTLLLLLAIGAAWAALRLVVSLDSPRTADTVDTLGQLAMLQQTENTGLNVLRSGALMGVPYLPFVVQGAGLFGSWGLRPTLLALQLLNVVWSIVTALGLGWIAARLVSPLAAPIAAAAFLFSPFMLLGPMVPIPMFHGALIATGLLLLLLAIHERRSPAAMVAFGTLAGIGCSHPPTFPFTALVCALALWSARRPPRVPWPMIAAAVLCFAAAIWPGAPSPQALRSMRQVYARAANPWRPLEFGVIGQLSPDDAQQLKDTAHGGPLDIVLGTLLTPLAIPRTAIRLWGDALFDPVGTGLALCATLACLVALRRSVPARLLLAVLVVALLPGIVSSYDRPSLTRMSIAPVGVALLAGVGFELIRRSFVLAGRPLVVGAVTTAAIAVSGMLLFDVITPRILPASAFGLALESYGRDADPDGMLMLDYDDWNVAWLGRIGHTAAVIHDRPIAVARYTGDDSLAAVEHGARARVVFWAPGLERYRSVAARICARWPQARVYTITDRPGCSHVFAAALADDAWRPLLPQERWSVRPCALPNE